MRILKVILVLSVVGVALVLVTKTAYILRVRGAFRDGKFQQLFFIEKPAHLQVLLNDGDWKMVRVSPWKGGALDSYFSVTGWKWNSVAGLGVFSGKYLDPKRLIPKNLDQTIYAHAVFCAEFGLDSLDCSAVNLQKTPEGSVIASNDSAEIVLMRNCVVKESSRYTLRD